MFNLPEMMTIHNVQEVQEQLLGYVQQLSPEEPVVLNAEEVQDADAAGIQLLLSAAKTFRQEGRPYRLVNCQELLERLLTISGASDIVDKGGGSENE